MPSDTQFSIAPIQQQAVTEVFQSLNDHGLLPLGRIPKTVLVNPVTQTQMIANNICVNYLNLHDAGQKEADIAIKVAIEEEYCGVYGICLERQWPFQSFTSPDLLKAEATERLMQSIVFLLKPPTQFPITAMIPGSKKATKIAFYEGLNVNPITQEKSAKDGPSRSRGKNLVSGTLMHSDYVTEIKTEHGFDRNEILAIFVPEHLFALAANIFKGKKIISVASKAVQLQSVPEILSNFHAESLKSPLSVLAPDYVAALSSYCKTQQIGECSIHAVRLHTEFDFMLRSVEHFSKQKKLILATKAEFVGSIEENSLVVVHKNFGLSKDALIKRQRDKRLLPEEHVLAMKQGGEEASRLNRLLVASKGTFIVNNVYGTLSKPQIAALLSNGVAVLSLHYYSVLHYPKAKTPVVTKIIKNFNEIEQSAAIKIQTIFRKNRTKLFFNQVKKAHDQYTIKQMELGTLEETVRIRQEELRALQEGLSKKQVACREAQENYETAHSKLMTL